MSQTLEQTLTDAKTLDDRLSNRFIELDPGGYWIIYLDRAQHLICAEHYTNVINDHGLACDPETGQPLPCNGKLTRIPTQVFRGRTAKEICVQLFEQTHPCPVTRLDHASYLGREFQRAEFALLNQGDYLQD
jgi:dihydropteroate synthase